MDVAKQRARLEELLATLQGGDVRRGQAVFNSTKASCSACHAIGYMGGNVGPDLTHIAKIRNERDLLESIVFPSASIVRSYEPVAIATKDGKLFNGLIRREVAGRNRPGHRCKSRGANRPRRHRVHAAEQHFRHARRPRPATDPAGPLRPRRLSKDLQVVFTLPREDSVVAL